MDTLCYRCLVHYAYHMASLSHMPFDQHMCTLHHMAFFILRFVVAEVPGNRANNFNVVVKMPGYRADNAIITCFTA